MLADWLHRTARGQAQRLTGNRAEDLDLEIGAGVGQVRVLGRGGIDEQDRSILGPGEPRPALLAPGEWLDNPSLGAGQLGGASVYYYHPKYFDAQRPSYRRFRQLYLAKAGGRNRVHCATVATGPRQREPALAP